MAASFRRPNILLLLTDQQRWDTIAAAGYPWMVTPRLDELVHTGAWFDRCYCNAPVCMPSRHSLLSGLYPTTVGTTCNGSEMDPAVPCIQHLLKPYGYHTANLGKLHFLNHSNRDHREPHPAYGFDTAIISDEPGCYEDPYLQWVREIAPDQVEACMASTPPACAMKQVHKQPRNTHEPYVFEGPEALSHTAFVAAQTIDVIERCAHQRQPFFAIAGFYAPHTPLNPPPRFLDLYDPSTLPRPQMNEGQNKLGLSDEEWLRVRQYYYALISHVDDQVGHILDTIDRCGIRDDTLVLFTSDHGEHLGDHGQIQKGPPGYDSCARVPLIARWPGRIEGGQRFDELIELVDLVPTLVDYAGIQAPPHLQGRSFRGLLEGGAYEPRTSAFLELRNTEPRSHQVPYRERDWPAWKTIRTERYKLCLNHRGQLQLYDLERDPHELTNVADDPAYAAALAETQAELLRRWFDVEPPPRPRTGQY